MGIGIFYFGLDRKSRNPEDRDRDLKILKKSRVKNPDNPEIPGFRKIFFRDFYHRNFFSRDWISRPGVSGCQLPFLKTYPQRCRDLKILMIHVSCLFSVAYETKKDLINFYVCFDEFYEMGKKHDGIKKIVVHFFLKSVNNEIQN